MSDTPMNPRQLFEPLSHYWLRLLVELVGQKTSQPIITQSDPLKALLVSQHHLG